MALDTIYNEDCLVGMQRIPDGTIDAVICDLPYGVLNGESEGGSWDTIIPFEPLWAEYRRVCKPTAAIVLFAQGMFTAKLMMSNEKMWRYNLIWDKVRAKGILNANRMPLRNHEDICVFYRQLGTYNPQMEALNGRERNHTQGHGEHKEKNSCYGKVGRINPTYEDKKHPRSIIVKNAVHCNEGQFHPTQKPVDLLRYLVLTYTNEGDTVLDNCMGSGTTAIACIKEKRHFIGFELNKEYYDRAMKRIDIERRQLTLF
jgi:site-specific DNA-methyltransferase (adenine-specific)/modification methylase